MPNDDLANLINPNASAADTTTQATTEKDDDSVDGATCQFCGITSPDFIHADKMDLHYVLQCTLLTNCSACTQIIEVSAYNDHKLN